jgi:hypothetical protein
MQGFEEGLTISDHFTTIKLSGLNYFHNSNTILLFKSRIFPEKSCPNVDHAIRFFPWNYEGFSFNTSFTDRAKENYKCGDCNIAPSLTGSLPAQELQNLRIH